MRRDSPDEESPSQPTTEGNQQEHTPTHKQLERGAVDTAVVQPSSQEDQWHDEQKRYWERQLHISKWHNWISGVGAAIATCALIGLGVQIKTMKTSLQTTERAWVSVKGAQVRPLIGSGKVPTVAMEWRSSGHSPASKNKIRQKVSIQDRLPDGPMPLMDTSDETHGIVGPDSSLLVQITPTNLTELPTGLLKTGKGHLYTFGTITYLDIFDIEHQTSFCFWLQDIEKLDMSPCGQWNEAN